MPEIKIGKETVLLLLFLFIFEDAAAVLIMLACVCLHECGHILASLLFGVPIKSLRFNLFGARIELGPPLTSYGAEFAISLAGPAVNITLAIVGIILTKQQAGDRLLFFTLTNFCLAVINLLPISTLDGGRMLCCVSSLIFGVRTAEKIMRSISFLFIILLWLASVFFWFRFEENISLAVLSMYLFVNLIIKRGY